MFTASVELDNGNNKVAQSVPTYYSVQGDPEHVARIVRWFSWDSWLIRLLPGEHCILEFDLGQSLSDSAVRRLSEELECDVVTFQRPDMARSGWLVIHRDPSDC